MAKTKEELDTLRIEYETLNNKLKELSDDELKTVVGGYNDLEYTGIEAGKWYTTSIHPDHVLKALNNSEIQVWSDIKNYTYLGVCFAKYWYDGVNAWNHGSCTSVGEEKYNEVNAPTNIFIKYTSEKPF